MVHAPNLMGPHGTRHPGPAAGWAWELDGRSLLVKRRRLVGAAPLVALGYSLD
jgi:hypothetical protein